MAGNQVLNDDDDLTVLPDPAIQFTPRAAILFKNFNDTVEQIVKYYVLHKTHETIMDNLEAVFLMGQEFGEHQTENRNNFYIFNDDAIAAEDYLDPIVSEAEFDDRYLMNELDWLDKTTPEERNYYETDIGLVTGSLIDALSATRSHSTFILSHDIKRILDEFEFYILQHLN